MCVHENTFDLELDKWFPFGTVFLFLALRLLFLHCNCVRAYLFMVGANKLLHCF